MPIIGEEWRDYDSSTFMCYAKMKHILRCVVCSEEPGPQHFNPMIGDAWISFLRCGHLVCNPCLETLSGSVGCTVVNEGMTDAAAAAEPGTSTAVSWSAADALANTPESWVYRARFNRPSATYTCPTCNLVTTKDRFPLMKEYVQRLLAIQAKFENILVEGTRLDIPCNECEIIHKESDGAVFTEAVKVCIGCVPAHFFCTGVCADGHAESTKHHLQPYQASSHEWLAMVTSAAWLYPNILDNLDPDPRFKTAFEDRSRPPAGAQARNQFPFFSLFDYLRLTEDIHRNIAQFGRMTECQRETVRILPELFPALNTATNEELAQDYFTGEEKVHTIGEETIKIDVLYRQTAHIMLIQAIVHIYPKMLAEWGYMCFLHFSMDNLLEYCFSFWRIPRTSDLVVTCNNFVSDQPFQKNLQKVWEQIERRQESDVIRGNQTARKVVEVSMQTYHKAGKWKDNGIKKFTYHLHEKNVRTYPLGSVFQKTVKIADDLYAVTNNSKLFLVRGVAFGVPVFYRLSPSGEENFGCGLWWNGRSLLATCIGTTNIAQWDFKKIKDTFIVHSSLHPISSKVPFEVLDTIVEVGDQLCICYDKLIPDREMLEDKTLECFRLTSGIDINHEFDQRLLKPPPVIQMPRLIGASISLPYVIIRDDHRDVPVPTLYVFSNIRATEYSWFRLQFSFPHEEVAFQQQVGKDRLGRKVVDNLIQKKLVKTVSFQGLSTLILTLESAVATPEVSASQNVVEIDLSKCF